MSWDLPIVLNLLLQGAAAAVVLNLGCTPGLFIVGLFGILVLWMYANFWITGTLFIVGGKFLFFPDQLCSYALSLLQYSHFQISLLVVVL